MQNSKLYLKGAILVIGGAVLWSLGGVGVKFCGFGGWQLAGLRGGVAAVAVLIMAPESRRGWSPGALLVGVAAALTTLTYVLATKTTTAANAIFIQCTYPIWLLVFGPFVAGERARSKDIFALFVFAAGLGMVFFAPEKATALSPEIGRGNFLALVSGFGFGLTILGLRRLREEGAEAAVVCGNATVCVLALGALFLGLGTGGETFTWGRPRDGVVIVLLGTFQIGLAYIFYSRGLRHIRAMQAGLIGLIEPVLNPIWVWLVFHEERPGFRALLGGVIILLATGQQVLSGARENQEDRA